MKMAPLPDSKKKELTDGMPLAVHISYQVTIISNLMSFGESLRNVKQFGITSRQWRVLGAIGQVGPLTARQIVDLVHQDKANISRAVAELEKQELVVKLRNKSHKNSPFIWMTENGKELYDSIVPTFVEQANLFCSVLTKKEQVELCRSLDKLKLHIEAVREQEGI